MLNGLGSAWLVVAAIALLAGLTVLTGNPAPAMLLLAFAYSWFRWLLLDMRPRLWWLPFSSIVLLLVVDWRRFTKAILPAFFGGLPRSADLSSPTAIRFSIGGPEPRGTCRVGTDRLSQ